MFLNELAEEIHHTAVDKGFWTNDISALDMSHSRSIGEQFSNFHSEISEAWEEYRNGHLMNEVYFNKDKPEGVPIEFADTIIRILHTCARYGIDIEKAIQLKMRYNSNRPYRHGGKLA
jgi:NTP pyrophosphatase (non-canonical NTP hydrolase)